MWYDFPAMETVTPENRIRRVCFTGHRELPTVRSAAYSALVRSTDAAIRRAIDRGGRIFYCGGAEGFDLLCGKLVLQEAARFRGIELVLLLPYTGFGEKFSEANRQELERQKKAAQEVVYLSNHYFSGCMAIRNQQLVTEADLCIAYLKTCPSGTAQTVGFARQKGIEVVFIEE